MARKARNPVKPANKKAEESTASSQADGTDAKPAEAGPETVSGTPEAEAPKIEENFTDTPAGETLPGGAPAPDIPAEMPTTVPDLMPFDPGPQAEETAAAQGENVSAADSPARPEDPFELPDAEEAGAAPETARPEPAAKIDPPSPWPFPAPPPPPPPAPRASSGGLILAGVVTAALGFAAAWWLWHPGGPLAPDTSAAERQIAELTKRVDAAEAALKEVPPAELVDVMHTDIETLAGRAGTQAKALDDATKAIGDLQSAQSALDKKIDEVAQRPPETDPEAKAAYEAELKAMRQTFDEELAAMTRKLDDQLATIKAETAQAAQAQENAVSKENRAEARAALARVSAALESGSAFGEALDTLAALRPDLPADALRAHADGVPTLAALQADFPEAARAALAAGRAETSGGLTGFLESQLGVRSLTPKEGDSADAVLSRAEDAVRNGDLAKALAELDTLPEAARPALAAWRSRAEDRLAALTAFKALSDALEA